MNSLVLKPCLCVVFFAVIPKVAPSASGLRRRGRLVALTLLRGIAGVVRDVLRLAREEVFLVLRLMPVVLFFER
jgi:hypothetical protein